MRSLTKIETVSKQLFTRTGLVERLTAEKPFKQRKFKLTGVIPYATSNKELSLIIENNNHIGLVLQTPFLNEVIKDKLDNLYAKNLLGEKIEKKTLDLFSGCITADTSTDWVYYRNGWELFKEMLVQNGITDFVKAIDNSFLDVRGTDIDKQTKAWKTLVKTEKTKIEYTSMFLKKEASTYSFYLSNGLPMLHRDNIDDMLEVAVTLHNAAITLSQSYGYPYQLSFNLHESVFQSSKASRKLKQAILEEARFGEDFESIAFKLANHGIEKSSIQSENFSKLLTLMESVKGRNKTTVLLNLDPALSLVALERGCDIVGTAIGSSITIRRSKATPNLKIGNGNYFNFMNLENLPYQDVVEKFFNEDKSEDGSLPHFCDPCKYLTQAKLKVDILDWNTKRKEHKGNCIAELNLEVHNELEKPDGSLWASVSDRIDRSIYKNYKDLILKPVRNPDITQFAE